MTEANASPMTAGHIGEPRWAMAAAVLATEVLHATLPPEIRVVGVDHFQPE